MSSMFPITLMKLIIFIFKIPVPLMYQYTDLFNNDKTHP